MRYIMIMVLAIALLTMSCSENTGVVTKSDTDKIGKNTNGDRTSNPLSQVKGRVTPSQANPNVEVWIDGYRHKYWDYTDWNGDYEIDFNPSIGSGWHRMIGFKWVSTPMDSWSGSRDWFYPGGTGIWTVDFSVAQETRGPSK